MRFLLALALCCSCAHAARWDAQEITWRVEQSAPEGTRKAAEKAFKDWSRATDLKFVEVKEQGNIVITATELDRTAYAQASMMMDGKSEIITGALIEMNSTMNWKDTTLKTIRTVLLHEIGHTLGLNHDDDPDAIMYPYVNQRDKRIHGLDMIAIRKLYPKKR